MSPVDRPLASIMGGLDPARGVRSGQIGAANASPCSNSSRVSARQLDRIVSRLDRTDQEVLLFMQTVRLASGAQLRRRFFEGGEASAASRARIARRKLGKLAELRVLDRLPRAVGGVRAGSEGFVYHLGPIGLRLLARMGSRSKRIGAPGDRYVRHTLAIAETVVCLNEAETADTIDVIEVQTEPTCWRGFIAAEGVRVVLKPDLFVRVGAGAMEDRWFVEVDLATESPATLIRKGRRYLDHHRSGSEQSEHGTYPRVAWAVPDERRLQVVVDALGTLPADTWPLFTVCMASDLIDKLAAEAAR